MARYNANGVPDSTFGTGGKVSTVFTTSSDEAIAMALQPDGKIVAGGYAYRSFALARYLGDPPNAPTNVTGAAVSTSQINLAWTTTSMNVTDSFIERSTDGINFTQVAAVGATVTSYSDTGLSPLTKYYYRIKAHHANGVSGFSGLVSVLSLAS